MNTHDGPSPNACQPPKYKHEIRVYKHPHADAPSGTFLEYSENMPRDCLVCCKPLSRMAGPHSVGAVGLIKFDPASTDVEAAAMALCNGCCGEDTVETDVATALKRDMLSDARIVPLDTIH